MLRIKDKGPAGHPPKIVTIVLENCKKITSKTYHKKTYFA